MKNASVKPQFASTYVAFGKETGTLGSREDLNELAIIAIQSGDASLKNMFEYLPPLEDLLMWRFEQKINVKK